MAPTVNIIVDPLTPEGHATLCEQVGKTWADRIALDTWRSSENMIRRMFQVIDWAANGKVVEVYLDKPEEPRG